VGLPIATGQGIRWCISVIHNQALNSKRKYVRWNQRDILIFNQTHDDDAEWGESAPCSQSATDFSEQETMLLLRTLPTMQYEVIRALYVDGFTQSEVAKQLQISQQHVCRLKQKALTKLREEIAVR
jgi:RNA polymerase sigma factor (sigma-70 family)